MDIHSTPVFYLMLIVEGLFALSILLLFLQRWKNDTLAAKYVKWQKEAQDVEVATHEALYGQRQGNPTYPNISIVVPACNQAESLSRLLPCLLEQHYTGNFEVIVADQISSDDTPILLDRMQEQYPNLRRTYVPATSRNIELRKLAITLGIKAARSEWAIVVNPDTMPQSQEWLQHYAENLLPEVDLVEAYLNFEDDGSSLARRAITERIKDLNLRLHAYENGIVLGCDTANYAVRRKWFLEQQGFADSLLLPFGEESLLAYHRAQVERTTLLCSPDTRLTEELPSKHEIALRRTRRAEVISRMKGPAHMCFIKDNLSQWLLYISLLTYITYVTFRLLQDLPTGVYTFRYLYMDVTLMVLTALSLILQTRGMRTSLQALNERKMSFYLYAYDLLQPWRNIAIRFQRRLRQHEFVRSFLRNDQSER